MCCVPPGTSSTGRHRLDPAGERAAGTRGNAYYYRQTGLDDDAARRSRAVFERVLGDGAQLTRKELAAALAGAGLPHTGVPLAYVIIRAELDGVLISGAMRGKHHTYALLDVRVPPRATTGPGRGTSGADPSLFRRPRAGNRSGLLHMGIVDGGRGATGARHSSAVTWCRKRSTNRTYWSLPADRAPARRRSSNVPVIDLLQDYDEYVIGYFESRDVILHLVVRPTRCGRGCGP